MKLYIAGPMRGIPHYNFPKFLKVEVKLRQQGYDVINPAKMDKEDVNFDALECPADTDWAAVPEGFCLTDCINRDFKAVMECDGIYMLDGWEKSTGARAEKALAEWAMKEVLYETDPRQFSAQERKERPVYSGVLKYFPDAILEVANNSFIGNEQHNPGTPLHWDRSKSGDELDALSRHLIHAGTRDVDGIRHSSKVAWRALANLQKEIEAEREG